MINPRIQVLIDKISQLQKEGITVAEIGVFDGSTTAHYLPIIQQNNGKVYAVDWFSGNEGANGVHEYNPGNKDNILNTFKSNIEQYSHIVTILDGKSCDKISEIPDNSLDICFIDADHRYSSVYNDIKLCLPKMKKGGLIGGHDCEDINAALGPIPDGYLEIDYDVGAQKHWGTIKAVFDHFGTSVEIIPDPHGQRINCWFKQL